MLSSASRKKADLEARKLEVIVKAEVRKAYDQGLYAGTGNALTMMCYILHNSCGFGEKRLKRIVSDAKFLSDCVKEKRLTLADMTEVLKDECNFSIEDLTEEEQDADNENSRCRADY